MGLTLIISVCFYKISTKFQSNLDPNESGHEIEDRISASETDDDVTQVDVCMLRKEGMV